MEENTVKPEQDDPQPLTDEELAEYQKDQNLEEIADMLDVIFATALARGYSLEDLERVRAEKAVKRGCFTKRILLKEVYED